MGGNTYSRKRFNDNELRLLMLKIDGYTSLFDDRTFSSEKAWRANISRHLDADSANRFFFMIEELVGLPKCNCCSAKLTIESFSYTREGRGFRKYCPICTSQGVWKYRENYDPTTLKRRGSKITIAKLNFYSTDEGKKTSEIIGKKNSKALAEFHKTDSGRLARKKSAELNSAIMKKKILDGSFTPNSNNRNTHWDSQYNGVRYRSSWEALYQCMNPTAEYEKLRITYTLNGNERIYIVDFIDHLKKVVTEVKPKELLSDKVTIAKLAALRTWAAENNYTVFIFNEDTIKQTPEPDYSQFDSSTINKLKKLYATLKN